MIRSTIRPVLICCAFISLLGTVDAVHAQPVRAEPGIQAFRPQTALRPMHSALRAAPIPIRIDAVEAPREVVAGEAFAASVLANVESASLPLRVTWDMGDGLRRDGLSIRHRYENPGEYEVTVRLQNPAGEQARRLRITVAASQEIAPKHPEPNSGTESDNRL